MSTHVHHLHSNAFLSLSLCVQLRSYCSYWTDRLYQWSMACFSCITSSILKISLHVFLSVWPKSHLRTAKIIHSLIYICTGLFSLFHFLFNSTTKTAELICCRQIKLHHHRSSTNREDLDHFMRVCVCLFWGVGVLVPICQTLINDSMLNISSKSAFIRHRGPFSPTINIAIYGTAPRLNKSIPKCTWPIQARLVEIRQGRF